MQGLNRVILFGRLGSDPKLNTSKNGKSYIRLNLATHRNIKNEDEQWTELTDWHQVYVWGRKSEQCYKNLHKGQALLIEGSLSYFESENDQGELRPRSAINARAIEFVPLRETKPRLEP